MTAGGPPDDPYREQRERDFQRYYKERDEWIKAMLDAERSYDTLLVSISTLALGASLTKGWVTRRTGLGDFFQITAWIAFAACLCLSLLHRYWTHSTHRIYVEKNDEVFSNWTPDAWDRVNRAYDSVPRVIAVERVKTWAGIAVAVGIIASFFLLLVDRFPTPPATPPATAATPAFNQTINLFPATRPAKERVKLMNDKAVRVDTRVANPGNGRGAPVRPAPMPPPAAPATTPATSQPSPGK